MGTEQPDTGKMHRLFDDALGDVDLTGDVVPGVLTGYAHRVKVRRYQAVGLAAVAVLATAGVAASALPHRGAAAAPAAVSQDTDYCAHQHWVANPNPNVVVVNKLTTDPAADQANCEALRTALRSALPDAQLIPDSEPDLTLDTRVDQALVKKIDDEVHYHDPMKGEADRAKYFGPELAYLADHPEDPANVYYPDGYTLVTAAGREQVGIRSVTKGGYVPGRPDTFVGSYDSGDCAKVPAALKNVQCTPVGMAGAWHGALWRRLNPNSNVWELTAVLTGGQGQAIAVSTEADDVGGHIMTEQQMVAVLDSSAFQKYADGYFAYLDHRPKF